MREYNCIEKRFNFSRDQKSPQKQRREEALSSHWVRALGAGLPDPPARGGGSKDCLLQRNNLTMDLESIPMPTPALTAPLHHHQFQKGKKEKKKIHCSA